MRGLSRAAGVARSSARLMYTAHTPAIGSSNLISRSQGCSPSSVHVAKLLSPGTSSARITVDGRPARFARTAVRNGVTVRGVCEAMSWQRRSSSQSPMQV